MVTAMGFIEKRWRQSYLVSGLDAQDPFPNGLHDATSFVPEDRGEQSLRVLRIHELRKGRSEGESVEAGAQFAELPKKWHHNGGRNI